ncbi:hypothetical protein KBB08_03405 [Candidatus Gracilibacteria bacterium]|nr:hypothetical protein [Candidatus Gracilibacteria bacterium]
MITTISAAALDRATLMLAAMPVPQLTGALASSTRTLSTRDIAELIGYALSYERGEESVNTIVGSASMFLSLLAALSYQRNKFHNFERQASDAVGLDPEHLEILSKLELHTQRTLQTQLGLEPLDKSGNVSKAIATFLKRKGIESPHAGDFIRELAHAVLLLADIERRNQCEVVRPHLLAILKGEKPSSLTPPVTGIV